MWLLLGLITWSIFKIDFPRKIPLDNLGSVYIWQYLYPSKVLVYEISNLNFPLFSAGCVWQPTSNIYLSGSCFSKEMSTFSIAPQPSGSVRIVLFFASVCCWFSQKSPALRNLPSGESSTTVATFSIDFGNTSSPLCTAHVFIPVARFFSSSFRFRCSSFAMFTCRTAENSETAPRWRTGAPPPDVVGTFRVIGAPPVVGTLNMHAPSTTTRQEKNEEVGKQARTSGASKSLKAPSRAIFASYSCGGGQIA